jgi:uncharacterized membrane protein YqjE
MAIFAAAGRAASTLATMVGTRLELAAVEFQEDARRLLGNVVLAVLAAFLLAAGFMLGALFVILLFWDTYPLQATAGMAILFVAVAALMLLKVRAALNAQPPLLASTLAELRKDVDYVRQAAAIRDAEAHAEAHANAGAAHE